MKGRIPVLLIVGGALVGGAWHLGSRLQPEPLPESPVPRKPGEVVPGASRGELDYLRAAELVDDPLDRCKRYPAPRGFDWPREMTDAMCTDFLLPQLSWSRVRDWIEDGDAEKLDTYFDELLEGYSQGSVAEGYFWFSYVWKFERSSTALRRLLDMWAQQRPRSAHAQLALAYHHLANAWGFRGAKYYREMDRQDQVRMRREVALAQEAAMKAITFDKRLLPAYSVPIRLAPLGADDELAASLASQALTLVPDSYFIRVAMMFPATPMWGGSFDEMDAIAEDGMRHVRTNPRMHVLMAHAHASRAMAPHQDDAHEEAARIFDSGLSHGPDLEHLDWGSYSQQESGDRARAVEYMSQTLRFRPAFERVRVNRATELARLGQKEWAFSELERILASGDNRNTYAFRQYVWMLINSTRYADAESRLLQLLPSEPKDRWVNLELAKLYLYRLRQVAKSRPYIDTLFALNPDDGAALLLQLDYIQNTDGKGMREIAERFVQLADESDNEQRTALPKVRRWLASQRE